MKTLYQKRATSRYLLQS